MKTIDVIQGGSNRNQTLRMVMLLIIAGTFPFYCIGVLIIGSAPVDEPRATQQPTASLTPLGADQFAPAATTSPAPLPSFTPLSLLQPTPRQFIPPTMLPTEAFVAGTVNIPPTATEALVIVRPTATAGPPDSDSDGLIDSEDSCPTDYGFADNGGCPYPDDPDRDGIRGEADACPTEFAPERSNGCRDFDDDGLDSSQDECPDEAGPVSNRGCPLDDAVAGG